MNITLPLNNWKPREYQLNAWKYLMNGGKHAELVFARRHGKDELALRFTSIAVMERVGNYWHMLPEYAQARKAIWDSVNPHTGVRRIFETFPKELIKTINNQEMKLTFINGSTWQVVGSDRYNSLVGASVCGVVYSEWALANPNAKAYIMPMLKENKGWQIFITTPRGRNHAYKTLYASFENKAHYAQIVSANDSGLFSEQELDEIKQEYIATYGSDYGTSKFEQEYLCSFDAANLGAILAKDIAELKLNDMINKQVLFDFNGDGIHISSDIGYNDDTTLWFWQVSHTEYKVLDVIAGAGLDADEWAEKIKEKLIEYKNKLTCIWLPHDAKNKTFAAKNTAIEIFIKHFGTSKIGLVPKSKIFDRVNAARVMIKNIQFNEENCFNAIEGLCAWSYEYNDENKIFSDKPLHNWASHYGDGFSYGCQIIQLLKHKSIAQIKQLTWI
jgi:phage terminase large subunit